MYKYFFTWIVTIAIISFSNTCFPQNPALSVIAQEDLDSFYKKLNEKFTKSECYSASQHYRIFPVFRVHLDGNIIRRKDFDDTTFLTKLKPSYFYHDSKKKKVLRTTTFILDENKNWIANYSYRFDCFEEQPKQGKNPFENLVNFTWDYENAFIFYIGMANVSISFIVTESKEIFVMDRIDGSGIVLPLKEYMDQYWERFARYWISNGLVVEE